MESQAKAKKLTDDLNDATKKRTLILSDLEKAQNVYKKALQEDSVEIQKVRYETAELNKTNKQSAKEALGVVTAYQKFAKEVNEAKNKAKSLGAEMQLLEGRFKRGEITQREYNQQINKLSKEYVEATVKAKGLDTAIKKIDSSVGDSQRNVGNYKSALGGLNVSFRNLIAAFGVVGAIDIFANLTQSSFQTIKQLDAQNASLKQIFETESQVAFQKEYLADVTNRYGLELISATDGYTKYAAAIRGTVLEGEKGRMIFSSFSGASAKLGLNAEQQTGIFKALEQMISKGTVQAEELRGQLGDRMPGAFKLFADAAGVSTKELGEMLKKGEVLSGDILPKVASELDKVYNLDNATKVDTLAAAQNRFKNSWTSFLDEAAGNKELINSLAIGMEGLGVVLQFVLDTLIVKGTDGISVVADLGDVLYSLFSIFDGLTGKVDKSLTGMDKFRIILMNIKGGIGLVSTSLTFLIEQLINLASINFDIITLNFKHLATIGDRMGDSADRAGEKFKNLREFTRDLQSIENGSKTFEEVDEANKYKNAYQDAFKAKKAYFQYKGFYFSTDTRKNTGKSVDDYIDRNIEGGTILEKKKKALPYDPTDDEKKKKPKKYGGARLSGEQRDYLMSLQALRDLELAINEKRFTENEINERKYLENSLKINLNYLDKKIAYLKGRNAKEKLEEAKAQLERAKLVKDTAKKIFDIDFKANEESYKIRIEAFEKQNQDLEQNDYLSNTDRLTKQIEVDNQMIAQSTTYWQIQIDLAKAANQETLSIERKRDEEINKLQENRLKNVSTGFENFQKDVEAQTEYLQALKGITFEEQRQKILSDKKLSNAQKEYLLDVLSLENQKEQNRLEIESLQKQNAELEKKAGKLPAGTLLTPEELQIQADNLERIAELGNQNIEIDITLKSKVEESLQDLKNIFSNGFNDLGLDQFANQFDDLFDKIIDGTANFVDYMVASLALLGDLAGNYIENKKNQELKALGDQLENSQLATEREVEFINERLDRLNSLQDLTKEQTEERNALEDEARVLQEQQLQREKLIDAQRARAEQRAAAQQALINGLVGAAGAFANQISKGDPLTALPRAIAAAAITLTFAGVQSALIMSKNPVPEYFVGRKGGKAEAAWTQEKGREIIASKDGKIKSLGSDSGPVLTKLSEGDKVFTAMESVKMLKSIPEINVGAHIHRIDNSKLSPIIIQNDNIDYDKLAGKVGEEFRRGLKQFDKTTYFEDVEGNVFKQEGGKIPIYQGKRRDKKTIIIKSTRNERN